MATSGVVEQRARGLGSSAARTSSSVRSHPMCPIDEQTPYAVVGQHKAALDFSEIEEFVTGSYIPRPRWRR
jgi:hypothetical protein